ncbi:MAG: PAS domain S-box protein [Richelia sp. CSU_2_1]|nr:PAS domain S-box protein [Richelia sp. CSU_2_1]
MIALFNRIRSRRWAKPSSALQHADILQNVSDAVIVTDLDFRIQRWNKAAEKMYGWLEQEVLGKSTKPSNKQPSFGSVMAIGRR